MSNYFTAVNGVKQGGVVSPVLFCIYIDDLLLNLSDSGVGCYIGLNFVGAFAYADDIVLLSPTPSAMRKLLRICDSYASNYDIIFNADKSKFLVIVANRWRSLSKSMNDCYFSIGGKPIENVTSYPHLGHIINSKFSDNDDILHRRNNFIGQTNNILCFFNKLDLFVKIKLFKAYCSSIYGCELWSLDCESVDNFCCTWRKALRRLLGLPYSAHSFLLPFLTDTLPIYDEICKRSARFIVSCLFSQSQLVRSVAWHGVMHGRYNSIIGKNSLICCDRFEWHLDDLARGIVNLHNNNFFYLCSRKIHDDEKYTAGTLLELIWLREGYLVFDSTNFLSISDLNLMIKNVATS
jgi:hypothetical protein